MSAIEPVTHTFARPVPYKNEDVASITFGRELLWGDIEDNENVTSMNAMNRKFLALMSGMDEAFFKLVPTRELKAMLKAAAPLMGNEEDMADLLGPAKTDA